MSLELLKTCIEDQQRYIDSIEDRELFEYVKYSLTTKTVQFKSRIYVLKLTYFQDIPEYQIIEVDLENSVKIQ